MYIVSSLSSADLHAEAPAQQADVDYFETHIRPVLIEHCYQCHSEEAAADDQLRGGLWVDSKGGLLEGGDSGPAVVPGDPENSLLLAALKYETFEMPPRGRLSDDVIQHFQTWIERGAYDPREAHGAEGNSSRATVAKPIDLDAGRKHWAYQPLPETVVGSIDYWVDQQIQQTASAAPGMGSGLDSGLGSGLEKLPPADRWTLARRLTIDLTGLPPTPQQLDAFANDNSPLAYENLVDRLMGSPAFGERWGRHWLDIVRYAESVTLRGLVQHQAWRYRDYVIDSMNCDLPYDQFLLEQIAGDQLATEDLAIDQRRHIATTFLTLGNLNLEDQDKAKLRMDAVDEQLTVIGAAFLGQTIGCARCHDHKFDPIPAKDYYALAGILHNTQILEHANVSSWIERPLPISEEQAAELTAHEAKLAGLRDQIASAKAVLSPLTSGSKSVEPAQLSGIVLDNDAAVLKGHWATSNHSPRFVGKAYLHDEAAQRGQKSATFSVNVPEDMEYEVRLSYSAGDNRSSKVFVSVQDFLDTHSRTINQKQTPPLDSLFVSLGKFRFAPGTPGVITISNAEADGHTIVDAIQLLPIQSAAAVATETEQATESGQRELTESERKELQQNIARWEQELKQLSATGPERPLYMAAVDEAKIEDLHLQIRGNVHQLGPLVPRGFLQVATVEELPPIPADRSGRLELGKWLTDKQNPLTARVFANRVWMWLCGEGIVRSVDNFGTTGTAPTHPELLDYLARKLIDSDWSTKQLVREIVLSETYQRSSQATSELLTADPENRLLLYANRKPLAAEAMMDSMLQVSGQLNGEYGGKLLPDKLSADYDFDPTSNRRAVYWPALRNSQADIVTAFNGAHHSLVTGRRDSSTVAPQALLLLNHPWVIQISERAAEQMLDLNCSEDQRIRQAFLTILGREPTTEETRLVTTYLQSHTGDRPQAWSEFVQSLFATVDFRYVH